MKRLLSLLFALLIALSLAACSGTSHTAPSSGSAAELTLLPADNAVEEITSPDPQTSEAQPQAPPAAQAPTETQPQEPSEPQSAEETNALDEHGTYDSKEDVALFIHLYGHLPDNYLTKKEAEALGWSGGSLEPYAPGKCIGGSRFGNYEGLLPTAGGRKYTECDIGTLGAKSRGAKRIVFSNDGLIYYTGDHYKTFELFYGEE